MRFLADESCDFTIVSALRQSGHDVVAVAEVAPSADDEYLIELGLSDGRLLLTEDKDFGQWVYANRKATGGVIFLRYSIKARHRIALEVTNLVNHRGNQLAGCFIVVQPGRVRIRRPAEH